MSHIICILSTMTWPDLAEGTISVTTGWPGETDRHRERERGSPPLTCPPSRLALRQSHHVQRAANQFRFVNHS